MLFQKIVSPGIAHNSYIIGSGGEAAVIDPRRDAGIYLRIARDAGMRIAFIFETHRNEDYVIGSCELAARCGAEILHGRATAFGYGTPVKDGDSFMAGDLGLAVLETPGHTDESISVAAREQGTPDGPLFVFSGDALFAGDTGRTDFLGDTRRDAGILWDSITGKILPLGDGTILCPAHGAGSVCGAEISSREYTTIGYEKANNPLLSMTREEFVRHKAGEHHYTPPYFRRMEVLNRDGPPVLGTLPEPVPLKPAGFRAEVAGGAQVVDIRSPTSFAGGHIPGSLSIWRDGLPSFAGWFLGYDRPILLVDDFNTGLGAAVRNLVRLGYDNVRGYHAGGFSAWSRVGLPHSQVAAIPVQDLAGRVGRESLFLLDVRDIRNRAGQGEIPGSHHIYIGELPGRLGEVPEDRPVVVYCDAGFKGSLATSILSAAGYTRVSNLLGGFSGWKAAGYRIAPAAG